MKKVELKKHIKGFMQATNKYYIVASVHGYLHDFVKYVEWREANPRKWSRREIKGFPKSPAFEGDGKEMLKLDSTYLKNIPDIKSDSTKSTKKRKVGKI